ncbi:MAG: phosphoribosylanthranilate isomerase, partial [Gemmatimonadetes bacterium]|nr:phosphoribosylanthranilate isomerase [Gemmatimonadota bacterium]
PGFARSLTIDQAERVAAAMGSKRVGVMVDPEPAWAVDTAVRLRLDVVQLHGGESPEVADAIRGGGDWSVWKVFPLADRHDLGAVAAFAKAVDGVHVDARRPDLRPGGGTGRTFRWDGVSDEVRRRAPGLLFIAAGGLEPANVCKALHHLGPDVVDASSGVESEPGKKDARRVSHFIQAVHRCAEVQGGRS